MNERLTNQKDNLAKLMATENLTVVHRKVPTAYFDLKNRLLCCPILKEDISSELYDLFMGHEVSHALHTPYEGVHSAVTKNKTLKGYLNVVEDVRIERFIKDKYPGLRKSFFKAYNELMEMDFFGVHGRDLNKEASLIDKINLITKCGSRVNITLSKEEKFFLDWAMKCDTWEEVEECANAIYNWSKENETRTEVDEDLVPQMFDVGDEDEDEDYEDGEEENEGESWEASYGDSDEEEEEDNLPEVEQESSGSGDQESEEGDEETEEENKTTGTIAGKGAPSTAEDYDDEDGARESITEHNAHNNEEMFISEDNSTRYQIKLDDEFKKSNFFKDYVTSYKEVDKVFTDYHNNQEDKYYSEKMEESLRRAKHSAKKLESKNKSIVMHMAKEFEMRQTAQRAVHAFSGKTGKLDMNRLAKYQIVDDVFKRVTYMPDGKNHGVNILVDWSGSIHNEVMDILEQTFILTMFCRKVDIPHRVYLFSDAYHCGEDNWRGDRSTLIELFSNEMNGREFKKGLIWAASLYNEYLQEKLGYSWGRGWEKKVQKYDEWYKEIQDPLGKFDSEGNHIGGYIDFPREWIPHQFRLGGTPLDQALVATRTLLKDFIRNYSVEKSILTVITDGYSHTADSLKKSDDEFASEREQRGNGDSWNTKHIREIIDPYSKRVYPLSADGRYYSSSFKTTQNLLDWLSKETGTTVTGYFVCSKKGDAVQVIREAEKVSYETDVDDAWRQARKGGFILEAHGYNKLFITAAANIGVDGSDELDDELVDAKKTRVLAAFKKNQKSKTTSRFLTNEFIKEIA